MKASQVRSTGMAQSGYVELKNVFLLPHIGTATVESRTNMGMVALDNIDAVLNGRAAPSLANV